MIARIHGCGRATRGLVAYVTHNQNSPQNSPPSTAAGVGFAESVNFLQCAPQLAGLIMARTAADAEFLKRESGHLDQGPEIEEAVRPLQPQSGRAGVVADHPADRLRLEVDVTRACRRPPRSAMSDNGGSADNPSSSCAEETCQSIPASAWSAVSPRKTNGLSARVSVDPRFVPHPCVAGWPSGLQNRGSWTALSRCQG